MTMAELMNQSVLLSAHLDANIIIHSAFLVEVMLCTEQVSSVCLPNSPLG